MNLSERDVERFWSKVAFGDWLDCWLWQGSDNGRGYVQFWLANRRPYAHRVAYELLVGPIPEGLTLDHLCRVRHCVNPMHLEPVTMRENLMRSSSFVARNARKTHCGSGHEFDVANTYIRPDGARTCRTCNKHAQERLVARRGGEQ